MISNVGGGGEKSPKKNMSDKPTFEWTENFLTHLKDVDDQHLYLVEIINSLSNRIFNENLSFKDLENVFVRLVEYTKFHFSHEESLMAEKKLDILFIQEHVRNHKIFIEEVGMMYKQIDPEDREFTKAKELLNFLINWLAFHILEQDQNMSEQIFLIDKGYSSQEAFTKVVGTKQNTKTEPLVKALKGIMEVLRKRNHELIELSASLEVKVQERTRELIEANRHLKRISLTDPLTKLPNRRYAMNVIKALWKESKSHNLTLTCLMIDADHFKEVNDNFGHDIGDKVLRVIARCLRESVRTDDIVCRLGGDEFLIICPNTMLNGGRLVANNVLKNINRLKIPISENNDFYKGSVSIGVASLDAKMNDYNDLIKKADESVYKAKQDGKNCVRFV